MTYALSDTVVWHAAKDQGFVIVTRDADFEELSLVWGQPPKVLWFKILVGSRTMIEEALLNRGQVSD